MTQHSTFSRRRVIGTGLAAMASLPFVGCATMGGPSIGRVVTIFA